jgi:hypothetical protein
MPWSSPGWRTSPLPRRAACTFYSLIAHLSHTNRPFPKGNTTAVTSLTSDGKVAEMQRSDPVSGVTESYLYTYLASPDLNAGQISNITLRRQVNGGAWTIVRQVSYDYYDGTSQKPYGNLGDLRLATIKDANGNAIDTDYYRYYTPADSGTGYVHGLKYVFSAASYARLAADIGNPLTATDSQVSGYADKYFEYDSSQRVTKAVVQASGCSVCTGGQGTFTYAYTTSSNLQRYNSWIYFRTTQFSFATERCRLSCRFDFS